MLLLQLYTIGLKRACTRSMIFPTKNGYSQIALRFYTTNDRGLSSGGSKQVGFVPVLGQLLVSQHVLISIVGAVCTPSSDNPPALLAGTNHPSDILPTTTTIYDNTEDRHTQTHKHQRGHE